MTKIISCSEDMKDKIDIFNKNNQEKALKDNEQVVCVLRETYGRYKILTKNNGKIYVNVVDFYDYSKGNDARRFDETLLSINTSMVSDNDAKFEMEVESAFDNFFIGSINLSALKNKLKELGVSDPEQSLENSKRLLKTIDNHTSCSYLFMSE